MTKGGAPLVTDPTGRMAAARLWSITSLDPEVDLRIPGQYPIRSFRESRPARLDAADTAGPSAPVVLSAGSGPLTEAFSTEFRSLHYSDDLRPMIAKLRALRDMDPRLGRHLRVRLEAPGVVIEGKASRVDIEISDAWVTGLPRVVAVDVEITEDGGGLELQTEAPTKRETVWVTVVSGEGFEHLAARFLGDAEKSGLVRQINPGIQYERPGTRVRVFEPEHPAMRQAVRPFSVALGASTDFAEAFTRRVRAIAQERAVRGYGGSVVPAPRGS